MASIQTAIELYDGLTAPMMNIINAVNMGVSSMYEINEAMSSPIDTASFDNARENINRAEIAVRELDNAIRAVNGSDIEVNVPAVTAPVEVPFKWQSYSGLEVFTNTGVERFEQELASVNSMLEQLNDDQFKITMASNDTDILSPDAAYDIRSVEGRVQSLIEMIRQVEDTSLDVGTDNANANLERLRSALSEIINLENRLKKSMQGADLSEVNSAFMKLSENITHTERLVRDTFSEIEVPPVEVPFKWQTDNIEIFTNTGVERFQQEIQGVNFMLNQLAAAQTQITQQAEGLDIIPPEAVTDIQGLQSRIQELQASIEQIEQNSVDIESGEANNKLERLRAQLAQVTDYQENLNLAMSDMDAGNINEAYLRLSQVVGNVERSVRDSFSKPIEILITWNSDNLDVFTGTGIDRFQQEIRSTNNMLNTLNQTQTQITQTAMRMDLFPANAVADMNAMQSRLQAVQQRIQAIESNPLNMGTDTANAELERLRGQLSQAVSQQENLNRAVENMDVEGANQAYLHLSQTIGNTERYIRDNIDEQGNFNREIECGTNEANDLMQTIKGAVAAYASIQTAGKIIDLSDTMTQTTARLDLIVDDGGSVEELQNKIYASAQNARGSYLATADAVSKLGMQASQAFTSNDELIAFTELLNKQFVNAGTNAQGVESVMLQLTQAMAAGRLQGEELNAVLDNASPIVQDIQRYLEDVMNIDASNIKELASEGVITSDVIKNSMFYASDEINAKFESMPMTFSQIWTSFKNTAMRAFQPVLRKISEIANSEQFQNFVDSAVNALSAVAEVAAGIFDILVSVGGVIADNWSWLSPIIYGVAAALAVYYGWQLAVKTINLVSKGIKIALCVASYAHAAATGAEVSATAAATAAQYGLNTAMYACPIVWIIILIIALIALFYAVIAAINKFAGTSISATGIICGAFMVAIAFIGNRIVTLINFIIDGFARTWNFIAAFVNFFGNAFDDPVGSIVRLFRDLVDNILSLLQTLASAIDTIFGSDLAGSVQGWRDSLGGWVDDTFGKGEEIMAKVDAQDWHLDRFEYKSSWNKGYKFGKGIEESIANFDPSSLFGTTDVPSPEDYVNNFNGYDPNDGLNDIGSGVSDIAGNTSDIADAMDITEEDLKYLRDIAEKETVNRFTTAEIKIEQTNNNTISSDWDIDGVVDGLTEAVDEAVNIVAEGVHV